ncbi:MAG: 6,7-dimethyl-8-ribityllumazine synthase [Planctomycetota bacterium]|nr:6,7-dimethyl-8-ribityllumazine synthase [Planctomycetota bacterium]
MALDDKSSGSDRRLPANTRIAVVVSEYHRDLTGAMLESARATLVAAGLDERDFEVAWVPGAFELPIVAQRFAERDDIDAVLTFGLVLTGETTHDRWVSQGTTLGITQASLQARTPILFGVLTCQTLEQARDRALPADQGGRHDKGREVARAAVGVLAALELAAGAAREGEVR